MKGKNLRLENHQIGTLLITGRGERPRYWRYRCTSCRRDSEAPGSRLKSGKVRCPCQRSSRHGEARRGNHSPLYRKWREMKSRVKRDPAYLDVGMDPRWEEFKNFRDDMTPMPEGYSLDRINPFEGYCSRNCRWVPPDVQASNKRKAGLLRYDWAFDGASGTRYGGALGTAAEWAWYLRSITGNESWTTARLRDLFTVLSLEDILKATSPWGVPPEELSWMAGKEFRGMWDSYQRDVYLQAA